MVNFEYEPKWGDLKIISILKKFRNIRKGHQSVYLDCSNNRREVLVYI